MSKGNQQEASELSEAIVKAAYWNKLVFATSSGRVIAVDTFNGLRSILGESWEEVRANDYRVKRYEHAHNPDISKPEAH